MTEFAAPEGPIREVATGMTVVDADGETVGTVGHVHTAGRSTAPADRPSEAAGDPFGWVAETFDSGTGLSRMSQERLARLGYVRVDAGGLFTGHRYVEADQIASVAGDEVRLSVAADQLLG